MRTWIPLLFLAGIAFAQDMDAPAKPEAPVDEWLIEKPESNPTGEPIRVKIALEPGWAHRVNQSIAGDTTTQMGPTKMEMGANYLIKVLKKHENGEADYEMPIEFTKFSMNGMDMLANIAAMLQNPKVTGRLNDTGKVIEGSTEMHGMGMIGQQMGDQLTNVLAKLPDHPVRKGEVWELPIADFAKGFGIKGGTPSGNVYQKLEDVVVMDDKKVAVIRTLYSVQIKGDNLQAPGMAGKGVVKMKGESLTHFGLDGYLRKDTTTTKMNLKINPGGMPPVEAVNDMKVTTEGGKVRFDAVEAAPEMPK